MGLEDRQLAQLYQNVMVGVILRHHYGLARDLWGITKIKMAGKAEHAVVVREMLHHPNYWVFLALKASAEVKLQEMEAAFANPAYPLTLGRSDELVLAKTRYITELQPADRGACYKYTVLPFDYRKRRCDLEKVTASNDGFLELPQVFTLPVAYSYDKARRRSVAQYGVFTHVFSTGVSLTEDGGGWRDEDRHFFLY